VFKVFLFNQKILFMHVILKVLFFWVVFSILDLMKNWVILVIVLIGWVDIQRSVIQNSGIIFSSLVDNILHPLFFNVFSSENFRQFSCQFRFLENVSFIAIVILRIDTIFTKFALWGSGNDVHMGLVGYFMQLFH